MKLAEVRGREFVGDATGYRNSPDVFEIYDYYRQSNHKISWVQAGRMAELLEMDGMSFEDADTWTLGDLLEEVKGL